MSKLFQEIDPDDFVDATTLMDRLSSSLIDTKQASEGICYRCGIYFRHTCQQRTLRKCSCNPHPFLDGEGPVVVTQNSAEEE